MCRLELRLPDLATGLNGASGSDDHESAAGVVGAEYHALALDALELAGREIGDEAHLLAHQFLGLVPLGDAADDGAALHAVVDGELEEFVGLLHLLACHDGSHTNVEFGKIVDGA